MGVLSKIFDILTPVKDIIDELHTSDEERLTLKQKFTEIQAGLVSDAIEMEKASIEAQSKVLIAEAQSESWITRNWRPITMLTFVVLILMVAFGWMDMNALTKVPEKLWSLLEIGIGGYIGGRTVEKTVPAVIGALKQKED